ncbi:ankyrin repeat-containing domain protein [Aspergillus stella-maris]|uniref:ankyrin repeat-containing domain protein n=1 Tax=Aspergillus stella-maris TaxID=1810926 RepID=UPI003CCCB8AE
MKTLTHDAYTVGWFCVLESEQDAATALLDEEHNVPRTPRDENVYVVGRIGQHNVVIVRPVTQGRTDTAAAAVNMVRTFQQIRFGLMVGVAGGATSSVGRRGNEKDILLGDVVVSRPHGNHGLQSPSEVAVLAGALTDLSQPTGGLLQYDKGAMYPGGFKIRSHLNGPQPMLISAAGKVQSNHNRGLGKMQEYIDGALLQLDADDFSFPGRQHDYLFETIYHHASGGRPNCCDTCDEESRVKGRETRVTPVVHYGLVASADTLLRDGEMRDRMRQSDDVLCFEMEAAGLANRSFPCIAICGISDYADTHKNKLWQPYAALVAGAYAKELLSVMEPSVVERSELASKQLTETMDRLAAVLDTALLDRLSTISAPPHPPALVPMGQWILESEEFENWVDGAPWQLRLCVGGLLIRAILAFQTALSSIIALHLRNTFPSRPVVHISLSDEQREVQQRAKVLGSFIRQLIEFDATAEIPEKLKQPSTSRALEKDQMLKEILEELVLKYDRTYLIVDGLNECSEDVKEVVRTYPLHLIDRGLPISLLTTSLGYRETTGMVRCGSCGRPNVNIYFAGLRDGERYDVCLQCKKGGKYPPECNMVRKYDTVRLEVRAPQSELETYCLSKLAPPPPVDMRDEAVHPFTRYEESAVIEYLRNRPGLAKEVSRDIAAKAQGKVIVAEAWTAALLDLRKVPENSQQLFRVLDNVPGDYLKGYCNRRIDSIKKLKGKKEHEIALRTFAFLIATCRPLTLLELQHALALTSDTGIIEKSNINRRTDILRMTAGLITIDKGDAHHSFVRFFNDAIATALTDSGEGLWLRNPSANMARVCLDYLKGGQFLTHCDHIEAYPFLAYALEHWGDHVRNSVYETGEEAFDLLQDTEIYTRIIPAMACVMREKRRVTLIHQDTSVIHLCAWFGLSTFLPTFLNEDHDINAADPRSGRSVLRLACLKGHEEMVRKIIKMNARIDNKALLDTICGLPGIADVGPEQESRVGILGQLLASEKIDINAGFGKGARTALMIALKQRYYQLAGRLLDDSSLALDVIDVHGHTALWYAVYYKQSSSSTECLGLIRQLVQGGSNPSHKDRAGRTILSLAVAAGESEAVKELAKSRPFPLECERNLLHIASAAGQPAMIRLLYSAILASTGVAPDINARDDNGLTPLHYAALSDRDEVHDVATTLIDLNADIYQIDSTGCTPYTLATLLGHEDVASVLYESFSASSKGTARTDMKSLTDLPAISLASIGHWEIVKDILKSGHPMVMHRDILSGNNLVHLATAADHIDILSLIFAEEPGRELVSETNYQGQTPLHLIRSVDAARILVQHHCHVGLGDINDQTPLDLAYHGDLDSEVLKYLEKVHDKQSKSNIDTDNTPPGRTQGMTIDTIEKAGHFIGAAFRDGASVSGTTTSAKYPLLRLLLYIQMVMMLVGIMYAVSIGREGAAG